MIKALFSSDLCWHMMTVECGLRVSDEMTEPWTRQCGGNPCEWMRSQVPTNQSNPTRTRILSIPRIPFSYDENISEAGNSDTHTLFYRPTAHQLNANDIIIDSLNKVHSLRAIRSKTSTNMKNWRVRKVHGPELPLLPTRIQSSFYQLSLSAPSRHLCLPIPASVAPVPRLPVQCLAPNKCIVKARVFPPKLVTWLALPAPEVRDVERPILRVSCHDNIQHTVITSFSDNCYIAEISGVVLTFTWKSLK